jgi:hypothetical protein
VTSFLETILKVLTFLLFLLNFMDFGLRLLAIGLGICVCDMDVKDAIHSSSPETSYQEIPSFDFWGRFLSGWFLLVGSTGCLGLLFLNNMTGEN